MKNQKRILIIDDNMSFTKLLEALLKQKGYEVAIAKGGKEGIEMAKSASPDLILLDLGMPDLSGDVTALRIRSESKGCPIPIIALTGHGDPLTQATTRAMGFTDHIVKPFDANDLFKRIENVVK